MSMNPHETVLVARGNGAMMLSVELPKLCRIMATELHAESPSQVRSCEVDNELSFLSGAPSSSISGNSQLSICSTIRVFALPMIAQAVLNGWKRVSPSVP